MARAFAVRSQGSTTPRGLLALLLLLTGLAAWLGVDRAPAGASARFAQILAATEDAGSARLVETGTEVSLAPSSRNGPQGSSVFTLFATGSVDFSSDEFALRTKVKQAGPPLTYSTYVAPGQLFERMLLSPDGPFNRWTEQPISYDPVLSIPPLAVLQSEPTAGALRSLGSATVEGVRTAKFEIGPSGVVCSLVGVLGERLNTTTTVWVDGEDVLRRIDLDETVSIHSPSHGALHTTFTPNHFRTEMSLTLSDFGSTMVFGEPTNARKMSVEPSQPQAVPAAPRDSCQRIEDR